MTNPICSTCPVAHRVARTSGAVLPRRFEAFHPRRAATPVAYLVSFLSPGSARRSRA